ncbi:MAG: hypothetical protein IPM47_16185 [Sphingobacteriales bacterium]|nr:MAG: hypothetical protein IPM47_16185 [Sphingobacteriales bacterium]
MRYLFIFFLVFSIQVTAQWNNEVMELINKYDTTTVDSLRMTYARSIKISE